MTISLNEKIGGKIRIARKQSAMTQKDLGRKLSKSGAAIAYLEQGKRRVSPDTLQKIAEFTGKSLAFFYEDQVGSDQALDNQLKELRKQLNSVEKVLSIAEKARVKAERETEESEHRYQLLVENAPIGIVTMDLEGNIVDINSFLLKILESPSEEESRNINLLSFPLLVESGISELVKKCLETGKYQEGEFPYVSKWGKELVLFMRMVVTKDVDGNINGVQGIVEDVTKRREIENMLVDSERKFMSLTEQIPGMIYRGLPDWTVELIGNTVEDITGYSKEEFEQGKTNWLDLIVPEDKARVLKESEVFPKKACILEQSYRIKRKDGQEIMIKDIKRSVHKDGKLSHIDGIAFNFSI